jgi:hypothetical protein
MNVFISWSGKRSLSHTIAELLKTWLPQVVQRLECFLSSEDIPSGANWLAELFGNLNTCTFGIVCLTREQSAGSPWVYFEAGALATRFERARVCPLLIDLEPADVTGPLAAFQLETATKEGLHRLIRTINTSFPDGSLKPHILDAAFEKYWPDFEAELKRAVATFRARKSAPAAAATHRTTDDITREVLELLREIASGDIPVRVRPTHDPTLHVGKVRLVTEPELWPLILEKVRQERRLISAWLEAGEYLGVQGDTLEVRFPPEQSFAKDFLQSSHFDLLQKVVNSISERPIKLKLTVGRT